MLDWDIHSTYCVGRFNRMEAPMVAEDTEHFSGEETIALSDVIAYFDSGRIRYPMDFHPYLDACREGGQCLFDTNFDRQLITKRTSIEQLCEGYSSSDHAFAAVEFWSALVPVVIYRLAKHHRIRRATLFANGKQICFVRNARPEQGYVHPITRLGLMKGESFLKPLH